MCFVLLVSVSLVWKDQKKKLHRLGEHPAVVILTPEEGEPVRVAVTSEHYEVVLGPYGTRAPGA